MFLSVALKKPNGPSYGWIDVLGKNDDCKNETDWQTGDDINKWIRYVMKERNHFTHFIFYNDEEPGESKSTSKGHAKGVLAWNDKKLGWLIHSVPKYPQTTLFPSIDESQLIYGQSFLYVENEYTQEIFSKIMDHLKIMDVHIYFNSSNSSNSSNKQHHDQPSVFSFSENVIHVAKHHSWGKDLYEDFVGSYMKSPVLCSTWVKPPSPSTDVVKNVRTIKWSTGEEYQTSQDHSKYAVSMNAEHPWVLIGDINHMISQTKRGGGGMMVRDVKLWQAVNRLFIDYTEIVLNPNQDSKDKKWWECFGKCFFS